MKFTCEEIRIMDALQEAEISGSKVAAQIPSKGAKTLKALEGLLKDELIVPCKSGHKDACGAYEVKGWMFTHKGHMAYCAWCAEHFKEDEE